MRKDFLVFSKPEITNSDISDISKILKSGWIGTGPITNLFEKLRNFILLYANLD